MNDSFLPRTSAIAERITPLKDMVLVRRIPDEEQTHGGLWTPDVSRDKRSGIRRGEVLAVGPGDRYSGEITCDLIGSESVCLGVDFQARIPVHCRVGDIVLYERCPDNDVNVGGVDCTFLREEQHVLAIL